MEFRHTPTLLAALTASCGDDPVEPLPPPATPTTVTVSPASATLQSLQETVQLTATVKNQHGQTMSGISVSWTSSDPALGTVSSSGLVTAVANGTVTVTATAGSVSGSATLTVEQVPADVSVAPDSLVLGAIGDTVRVEAAFTDANGHAIAGVAAEWASADPAVATVDASGLVTAVANGTVAVTATAGSVSGSATLTVEQVPADVAVTPDSLVLGAIGDTVRVEAAIVDANGHAIAAVAAEWASAAPTVATVDASGLVTAVANGTVALTATAGSVSGSATLTVEQVPAGVAVAPDSLVFGAIGDTVRVEAAIVDANGYAIARVATKWASADLEVVTVDTAGLVTAAGNGTATVTASAGSASGSAAVTVAQSTDSVAVSPAAGLKAVGATVQLEAEAFDANGHAVAGAEFSWASSDDAVATVDATGLVTAMRTGVAKITAQADAAQGSAELTVVEVDVQQYIDENALIAGSLLWLGTDGRSRPYHQWPQPLKDKLALAVEQLLGAGTGLPDIMPHRAVRRDGMNHSVYSKDNAEDLYVANVAHSLLLEMAGTLPWSLNDLSGHELTLLFDSRHFYSQFGGHEGVPGYEVQSSSPPAPPEFIWDFMQREGLVGTTRQETITRTVHWARYHLYHFSYPSDWTNYEPDVDHWDYRGGAPLARVLEGTTRKRDGLRGHFTRGCGGTNAVLKHVLRAANIPVEYLIWGGHAVPYFPSEGLGLSHGDDPYSKLAQYASPFPEPFPTSEMLIPEDIYRDWFNTSNSDDENLNNVGRRATELGVKYLPQWLLWVRCRDIASGVSNADSQVYRPGTAGIGRYWTVPELEAMNFWERMDAKIAQYGGCSKIPHPPYRGGEG